MKIDYIVISDLNQYCTLIFTTSKLRLGRRLPSGVHMVTGDMCDKFLSCHVPVVPQLHSSQSYSRYFIAFLPYETITTPKIVNHPTNNKVSMA